MSFRNSITHFQFDDFDAFREATQVWDLDFLQLDRGRFNSRLSQKITSEGQWGRVRLGRRVRQRGQGPRGFRTFAIPADHRTRLVFRGLAAGGDDLVVFPEGGELDSVSEVGFDMFVLSFPEDALVLEAERLGFGAIDRILGASSVVHCGPAAMDRIRENCFWMESVLSLAGSGRDDRAVSEFVFGELRREILEVVAVSPAAHRMPMARVRSRALRRTLEHIENTDTEWPTIAELCARSGASSRTLVYAFQEHFGVTPKSYLHCVRLNRARCALRSANPGVTKVADIANEMGFWHMGQFAADYRRQFGQLPSEALGMG